MPGVHYRNHKPLASPVVYCEGAPREAPVQRRAPSTIPRDGTCKVCGGATGDRRKTACAAHMHTNKKSATPAKKAVLPWLKPRKSDAA